MDSVTLAKIIDTLDKSAEDADALLTALLLLIDVLQQPTAYVNPKLRPLSAFNDFIHWTMLAFTPVSRRLASHGEIALPLDLIARRNLKDSKFALSIDGLFPPRPDNQVATYQYDVCISFAGEQRHLAALLANTLKEEFFLKVFYDDFEKFNLLGKNLFEYLYEIYSVKAQYCIVLFSREYLAKNWTLHELRSAQTRILRERSPYVLPVLTQHNVEPPVEFENVAYLRLDPDDIHSLCVEVNERIWATKSRHWFTVEELTEMFVDECWFNVSISPFRDYVNIRETESNIILVILMGIIWCCSQNKVSKDVNAIIEYILFAFPPVSNRFNENNEMVIIPPNGIVMRRIGSADGALFMRQLFWRPIIERAKEEYPLLFDSTVEDIIEDNS